MENDKILGRLRYLLHKKYLGDVWITETELMEEIRKQYNMSVKCLFTFYNKTTIIEIYNLINRHKIDPSTILKIYIEERNIIDSQNNMEKINNCKVRRDNKTSFNIKSGGGGTTSIRYPRKNRSLATWRRFYKLFPNQAEKDGFDGFTSNKMK